MVTLLELEGVVECRLVERLNRFVAVVEAPDGRSLAYIANTGRLEDVLRPGRRCLCLPRRGSGRTRYRLVAAEYAGGLAVVDTRVQEDAVARAIERGYVGFARGCRVRARSPRLGGAVFDFLLSCGGRDLVVELKSAVLRSPDGYALYPDCPSPRGRHHLRVLADLAGRGMPAAVVFVAAFPGAQGFRPNWAVDPALARLLLEASRRGVAVYAVGVEARVSGSRLAVVMYSDGLPVELEPPL